MPWFHRWLMYALNGSSLLSRLVALTSSAAGSGSRANRLAVPGSSPRIRADLLGVPGLQQAVHGGVPFAGAGHQRPLAAGHVPQPVRLARRVRGRAGVRELAGRRVALGGRAPRGP